jgi:hypothetical protein
MSLRLRGSAPLAILLMACTEPVAEPNQSVAETIAADFVSGGQADRVAATQWMGVAIDLARDRRTSAPDILRGFALLGVAQYSAAIAAENARTRETRPSVSAAVSAASVVVLDHLFPDTAGAVTAQTEGPIAARQRRAVRPDGSEAGEAIGREIGARVVERARTDGFLDPWTGTVPVGPGLWFSTSDPPAPPVGAAFGAARPFLLRSGDQFRPPPPPAFGSQEFLDGLAEVRRISDTRTAEQDAIARFWSFVPGTDPGPTYWYTVARDLAIHHRLGEREAAHLFALMNATAFDALIASHDTKFTYWFIRPTQADPGIELAIGLPNFPSFPSNHATISSASARILGARFPSERRRLDALAAQAALSRVYGGIHYRFDGDVGLEMGRAIAAWAVKVDERGPEWMESGGKE